MRCTSPVRIQIKNKRGIPDTRYPDGLEVPCGKCMACRQQKRKEWSMRVLHESTEYRNKCFTTLTYSDDNLPENGSLVKRDLQLFFKRLRKALPPSQKIRYFACGEYGDTYFRPHYHTILFNLGLGEADQDIINNAWGKGFIKSGSVTPESIMYVAGYINKKFSGIPEFEAYQAQGREPVFRISSLGIGRNFCDNEAERLKQQLYTTINGHKYSLPRYYVKRLGIQTNDLVSKALDTDCETVEHYRHIYK